MARLDGRLGYARLAVAASREAVAGWAGPAQVPCRISTGHAGWVGVCLRDDGRSEEHTSELQSLAVISYAVFCLDRKSVV